MFRRVMLTIVLFFVSVCLAGAFQVPDTGIVECFNADGDVIFPCPAPGQLFYGQDGNVNLISNSMSYTDNGDTLTDEVTGLVWQKAADATPRIYDGAAAYCAALNLGGHATGWRLPALVELDSIMDLSVDTSTGTAAISPVFTGTVAAAYWTSTEDSDDPANAWILDFGTTENDIASKSVAKYTRCVWEVTP